MAVQQQDQEEAESRAEMEHRRLEAVAALRNQLCQERDRTEKLRAELAGVQQHHQRLQEEHSQSQLAASDAEREIAALETELGSGAGDSGSSDARVTETASHRIHRPRRSDTPPDGAAAPYGYWASPSGYRYGRRW